MNLPLLGHTQCPSRCGHGWAMSITCTHIEARWENAAGGGKEYQHTQGEFSKDNIIKINFT